MFLSRTSLPNPTSPFTPFSFKRLLLDSYRKPTVMLFFRVSFKFSIAMRVLYFLSDLPNGFPISFVESAFVFLQLHKDFRNSDVNRFKKIFGPSCRSKDRIIHGYLHLRGLHTVLSLLKTQDYLALNDA